VEKIVDEQAKNFATNAWHLLYEWECPPGTLDDGSFSGEALIKWVDEVKEKTRESGHLEVAMSNLGQVLFYVSPDPNGLWIQQSAAEVLNDEDDHIRQGFSNEVFNSRGMHTVDPSGKPERELAELWRQRAEDVETLGLINFATSLRDLANSYNSEAEQVISRFSTEEK